MLANINRGEYALTIGEQEYTLLLTLNDLEALEERELLMGAVPFFGHLRLRTAHARHIRAVLARAFRKADPRPDTKDVPELIDLIPFQARYNAVVQLVAGGLNMLDEQQPDGKGEGGDEGKKGSEEGQEAADRSPLSEKTGT